MSMKYLRNKPVDKLSSKEKKKVKWFILRNLYISSLPEKSYKCSYCECLIPKAMITLDHMVPKSKGGKRYCKSNIRLCCQTCNSFKGEMPVGRFLRILLEKRAS